MTLFPQDFDEALFLREYWQKKPLLIRASGSSFQDLISPEELAGLACEDFIESRLIVNKPDNTWQQRHGPFTEKDFVSLPEQNYALLVQAVDHWSDEVASLLQAFDFLPGWRIEDIMVSYATEGGNVGPHFDYYDVFLIQGMGAKQWQLGGYADSNSPLQPNQGLRLLRDFSPQQDWTLYPGDILYLPPNLAHFGTAIGKSMTYSVGFRTPSLEEIVSGVSNECASHLSEDQRYVDANPQRPGTQGEISNEVTTQISRTLMDLLADPTLIRSWFGKAMTQPRYLDQYSMAESNDSWLSSEGFASTVREQGQVYKNPGSRFAFQTASAEIILFADGRELPCPLALESLIHQLCQRTPVLQTRYFKSPAELALLYTLYCQGSLLLDSD
ncbi:MAG: cupin domain-containing protein [Pseudomonadales bacterium]|nr:cupin domain-containing protein [Pseudomonadales bacterium]